MSGRIIPMHEDPHAAFEALLPWHVTGRLDAADRARLEAHLAGCADCRAQLAIEERIVREARAMPNDVEAGWASLRERLNLESGPTRRQAMVAPAKATPSPTGRRFRWDWLGWGVGAQLALASLLAIVILPTVSLPQFNARTSAAAPVTGNAIVIFKPDTPESIFRQTLRDSGARLVDGPTEANAYVLALDPAARTRALALLRSRPHILLAEPIDRSAAG
jgi:hypothetical protein